MTTETAAPQNITRFERVVCNLCGSNETRPVFQKWEFTIVRCVQCGLVYVNPRAFRIEDDVYFDGPYLTAVERDGLLDPGVANLYGDIIYNLSTRTPLGKLLDVGCAVGHFMDFARRYGWQVEGVECSVYAARRAVERFGLNVHNVCVLKEAQLSENFYDACTLVEVVEHLPDPRETLIEVWRLLKPGALIYLTTPNFTSYRSLLLRDQWDAAIPTGHLYYFEGASLGSLLSSVGFIDVEDLTGAGDFAAELQYAETHGLNLSAEELTKVKELHLADPSGTRRAEGLVMCARKPWDPSLQPVAGGRVTGHTFHTSFEGCLVRRPGETVEDQKVYFIDKGRKRWVTTGDWIIANGMSWHDLQLITAEELEALLPGPPLP